MTLKEVSEIFGLLLLAYPNAELFKGGKEKLKPTIELWTAALPDVDFWTGKQAAIRYIRNSKFPPTIAEFRENAEAVNQELEGRSREAWANLKMLMTCLGLSPAEAVGHESTPEFVRQVVKGMGGPEALIRRFPDGTEVYAYYEFQEAFGKASRAIGPHLAAGGQMKQIGGKTK